MKLSECKIGTIVNCVNGVAYGIGYISGLTYSMGIESVMNEPRADRLKRIIPLVTFPNKETHAIHHANLVELIGNVESV